MKKLVLTIAIGDDYQKLSKLTHPSIKAYAKRIGADFHSVDQIAMSETTPHWEKFQIYHYLDHYDRILYIDTDIIVRDDTPNLFDIVPETHLGIFNEGKFTNRSIDLIIDVCKAYKVTLDKWDGRYFNTGVMVISKYHKSLFKKPKKEISNFFEQSYLNMLIAKRETDIFELTHKFNRMTCVDRFTGEERFDSYLIHYAGWYWKAPELGMNSSLEYIIKLIKSDIKKWKKDAPDYKYKKHIYINVTGGMGDQLCAEPSVRWMKKNFYPDDEVIVATHYPEFFKHIDNIEIVEHGKAELKEDTPYFITESLPGPDTITWFVVSHLLCHTVDYCSIALMKRTLPLSEKTIKFEINEKDYYSLIKKLGFKNISEYIVVHPGKHWNSKTFPKEYWQKIIDGLGKNVIVIGKTLKGDPPFYKAGARGIVNVDTTEVIDVVDKLSIGELAVLLSKAKCLVSNDSFPVHLAGAFDVEIFLIPSCKHPDHVLPYRNGSVCYKSKSFYKRLVIDDVESKPTQIYETSAEIDDIDWNKYLVEPKKIVNVICH
jgi:hypothetical protein